MGRTVEADKLQTVLTKADRQVSQFKGRLSKEKADGGGEVRTQTLVHDERRQKMVRYSGGARSARLIGFIIARVQPRVQSIMKASDQNPMLRHVL